MKQSLFLCLILACSAATVLAERHVHPNAEGDLVGKDGKPVFLISTTTHWGSMIEWYRHKHQFQGKWIQKYGWLYGQQICMDMFEKCGFNALNFREHGNVSWRALAPEYKGYSAKDPFDEYMEMTKKYKLERFREMKTRREYDDFHNLIASAKDIPVYLDFHGGYIARISQNREAFSAFLDPYKVFASKDTHPGFAFRFQFGTKEGREAVFPLQELLGIPPRNCPAIDLCRLPPYEVQKYREEYNVLLKMMNRIDEESCWQFKFFSLLYSLLEHFQGNARREQPAEFRQDHLVDAMEQLMLKNFVNPAFSLTEVAEKLGRSPNYLSARYSRKFGLTFSDSLRRKRMERAQTLLHATDEQIQTIAEQCGFASVSYFCRCFQQQFGLSPLSYRQQKRELSEVFHTRYQRVIQADPGAVSEH